MNKLFNDEDIDINIEQEQGPVTVLGITFASDDERRAYFCEELRKKLPELKHIEGFPIGEDDDIINLSDPPYYTACPNPWINDFMAEWEQEKTVLEQQGERTADFVVDEPYASDISEGKNNPIYNAHSYHTKVPHPAIMRYILHYTQPGDIILDGFSGTGMTGVAAGMCDCPDADLKQKFENEIGKHIKWGKRNAIMGDLSPIANLIAYNNNNNDKHYAYEIFTKALSLMRTKYDYLYKTKHGDNLFGDIDYTVWSDVIVCDNCGEEELFWKLFVKLGKGQIADEGYCSHCNYSISRKKCTKKKEIIYDPLLNKTVELVVTKPVLISYTYQGKRHQKTPDSYDLQLLETIDKIQIPSWVPINKLKDGDKMGDPNAKGVYHAHQFYFKRALIILSELWSYCDIDSMRFITNSISRNLTKLNRFVVNSHNPNGRINGPLSGTFYVPSEIVEQNVFEILGYKKKNITNNNFKNLIQVISATDNKTLKDSSVDYIFTDPPFGANIMYSELNSVTESWLKVFTNDKTEAIENKSQNKRSIDYKGLMQASFVEYYRVLKRGAWMTVEFSNTSGAIWNAIQTALTGAGFVIANVSALDKIHGGIKSMRYTTAVKQDLVISCYKPSADFDSKFQNTQYTNIGVWDFVEEHLNHLPVHIVKENATTAIIERNPKILYDRLIAFYVQKNLPVPIDAGEFQKGLKDRFLERDGMYFNSSQAIEYDEKRKGTTEFYHASLFVSSEQDGVMWLKDQLKESSQTYQELQPKWMQAIAGLRKGDILPELRDILQENFLQSEDGAWYLPDMENEIDLEKIRTNRLLKQFGEYQELASKPKAKIKEVRVEALRVGFKQCYKDKDFLAIVNLAEKIPNNLLMEDEVLLQYYDIASTRVER